MDNKTENIEEYYDWCFCNHIYFYSYLIDPIKKICTITKFVKGVATIGKKQFPASEVHQTIQELYKTVYLKNNNNIIPYL